MIDEKKFQNKILEQIPAEKWSCSFDNNLNLYHVIQFAIDTIVYRKICPFMNKVTIYI